MSPSPSWSLTAGEGPGGPLWTAEDVIRWIGMSAIGFVLYAVAWYLCADQARSNAQMGWANLGVAGLAIFGVANSMWLMRGHRAVRARARASIADLHAPNPSVPRDQSPGSDGWPAELVSNPVAGPGAHYHRPECPMAQGRDFEANDRSAHEAAGKRPCGICRP